MEIIIGIIVGFFLLRALTGAGTAGLPAINSTISNLPAVFQIGSSPTQLGAELSTNQVTALTQQASNAQVAVGQAASAASSLATLIPAVAPIPIAGPIIAAAAAVAQVLLAQHTARLKGAVAENQLLPQCVTAFDNDLQELADAYNAGQANAAACVAALSSMQTSLYTFMKGNATGPGRAWKDLGPTGLGTGASMCNKSCTTECCTFYDDFQPAIITAQGILNGTQQPNVYAKKTTNGWMLTVPEVYPPPAQYGNFSRPSYQVTFTTQVASSAII
jgi:hypothetical protein